MSAETPGTDHDDTEALTEALYGDADLGPGYMLREDCQHLAERVLASDWLAAYVARQVETIEQERDVANGALDIAPEVLRLAEMSDQVGAWRKRAEKAERERDEARAAIERVTALVAKWGERSDALAPRPGVWHADFSYSAYRTCVDELCAALAPTTEPASDRPLTLDEHLAEVERQIQAERPETGTVVLMTQHRQSVADGVDRALYIVQEYREAVRRG